MGLAGDLKMIDSASEYQPASVIIRPFWAGGRPEAESIICGHSRAK
jgi:hypothetical protein